MWKSGFSLLLFLLSQIRTKEFPQILTMEGKSPPGKYGEMVPNRRQGIQLRAWTVGHDRCPQPRRGLIALLNKRGLLPEEVLVTPSQRHKNATSDKKHPLQNFFGPGTGKVLLPRIHPSWLLSNVLGGFSALQEPALGLSWSCFHEGAHLLPAEPGSPAGNRQSIPLHRALVKFRK